MCENCLVCPRRVVRRRTVRLKPGSILPLSMIANRRIIHSIDSIVLMREFANDIHVLVSQDYKFDILGIQIPLRLPPITLFPYG